MHKKRSLFLVGMLVVGLIVSLLVVTGTFAVRQVSAGVAEPSDICIELHGNTIQYPSASSNALNDLINGIFSTADEILAGVYGPTGYVIGLYYGPPADVILTLSWEQIGHDEYDALTVFTVPGCESDPEAEFVAPALWLMALCEPDDGFSEDGWQSWDGSPPNQLYVAASMEGPWFPTEFLQPPYIMNAEHLNGLAAWMGLADWHQLWFKNGEEGQPVHVGTAVAERDAHMDEYCGE